MTAIVTRGWGKGLRDGTMGGAGVARGLEGKMFGGRRTRRQRARQRQESARILGEAKAASDTAREAMLRSKPGKPSRQDEELADTLQAAILGSMVPAVSSALDARHGRGRDRSHRGQGVGLPLLVGLAVGVGVAAWARREPQPSPLGEDDEWELADGGALQGTKDVINETLDRADSAIRKAVGATAASMGMAVDAVAEAAGPAAERVSGQLKVARGRATSEVIRALDDIEDVWGDEADDATKPTPKVPKQPTPRKPVVGAPSKTAKRASSTPAAKRKPPTAQGGA